MSTQSRPWFWLPAIFAVQFFAALAWGAAPSVDALLEPTQIEVGESARLTIFTSGSGTLSVTLPVVPGLEFRVVGQSRQIQIINGATLESTSTIVRVTAETAGIFTIPGLTPASPPLVLRVNPGNGSGNSSSFPAPKSGLVPPGLGGLLQQGGSNANGIRLTPDGSAFVRLEIPKHEIYVGESIPAEIQVGMRDGFVASINGLPTLNNSDFTLNNLSRQPERAAKVIEGKPFTVYTWHTVLSAIKPGAYSLKFEAPLTVRIRTRPRDESMMDDLLGDPFMQNIFGATVPKNITVTSPDAAFTVLALPTQGKPSDFTGAVGSFKISTDISSATNTAGDPLTLRMHVTGAGNFDRVDSTMLSSDGVWKTYEPKATFNPSDALGYRGEKTFEQPVIASQPGSHTIPPLTFSYFDPGTHRYEAARSAPLSVKVAQGPDSAANEPPPASTAQTPAEQSRSGLRPDHALAEPRVGSLVPLFFQPQFLGLTSGLALLLCSAYALQRRRERHAQREQERARLQLIHDLLDQMAAASAAGNANLFFTAARSALQQALGARWQTAPAQITVLDVDARPEGGDWHEIHQIFTLADEADYSGGALQPADCARWTDIVRSQLVEQPS
jgi:hypothetical protein